MVYEEAVGYLEGLLDIDGKLDAAHVAATLTMPIERIQEVCDALGARCDTCETTQFAECPEVLMNAGVRAGVLRYWREEDERPFTES